ncbi:glutaredoxin 2 [Acetobacter sp. TBRC 12305]|uniref:Glutaredoxin 2 n=1 Tax=Acetobacter garciniae TaxID=2817435 RepID=A0A939HR43_9PROT|nr:glutaredoxin 2 [Acetobacter garciniae]MBX0346486.1 glutaredoxin 2 [Acetobacter garciniae]
MYTLYVYEHCPFCIKARMIFGLKDVPFHLAVLLNDDEQGPIGMVGRKVVPILGQNGQFMAESLDIVARIDGLGTPALTGPRNPALADWLRRSNGPLYRQFLPRAAAAPFPEFATTSARAYFMRNKERAEEPFSIVLRETHRATQTLNPLLAELAPMVQAATAVNGMLSYDDIDLFAQLHSFSIIRGLDYPAPVEAYRQAMSKRCGIPLLDALAV